MTQPVGNRYTNIFALRQRVGCRRAGVCDLVMEQSHAGEGHDHVFSVALFDDQVVTDGATGFGEGALVAFGEPLGLLGEVVLPNALSTDVLLVVVDVAVNDVVAVVTTRHRTGESNMKKLNPTVDLGTLIFDQIGEARFTSAFMNRSNEIVVNNSRLAEFIEENFAH